MNTYRYTLFLLLLTLCLYSCQTDYAALPTYSGARQLQAVVETPAGSSHTMKYNPQLKEFENDKEAGKDRVINSLPYPGNYGFIPSTEVGSNGRGLSTFIIADRTETGTVMEVIPIATLMLEKANGDLYPVIISVPSRPSERLITATDYASLSKEYTSVKSILQQWFVSDAKPSRHKFISWKDEQFAEKEIQRWMKL
ncbi:inorganic diphosphatase [Pontibacter sp. KCTC 32443]|uniref:inorganic diphosphatase n=1 Tax=Pontibacter TaxID=323449 RepID=UPI00164DA6C3|nr:MULTISPECIES: inorganic diphosphatase [Pontibacter]MBC5773896.1 inorganic diphosphatase [Pontibacter sp. KCTC 32443]